MKAIINSRENIKQVILTLIIYNMSHLKHLCKPYSSIKATADIINNYTHVTGFQRAKLIAKEAYLSAADYHNGDHYSQLTDMLSFAAAKRMYEKMSAHETGKRILIQKPRITDEVYNNLVSLQEGTFGKQYFKFMKGLDFKPSQRPIVKYIPDLQYAYVLQRYKQIHDFLHVLMAKHISVHEELVLKWFQMRQLRLPSATLASLISPFLTEISNIIRVADRAEFVMNIYFQQQFAKPVVNIYQHRMKFIKHLDSIDFHRTLLIHYQIFDDFRQMKRGFHILESIIIPDGSIVKHLKTVRGSLTECYQRICVKHRNQQSINCRYIQCCAFIFNCSQFVLLYRRSIPEGVSLTSIIHSQDHQNYGKVWKMLKQASSQLGIDVRKQQQLSHTFMQKQKINYEDETIQVETWQNLRTICKILFQIMLKNEKVLYLITKMQERHQVQIKQYIETNEDLIKNDIESPGAKNFVKSSSSGFNGGHFFIQKIEELEQAIIVKDQEIAKMKQKLGQNKQEIGTMKVVLHEKQIQIQQLKKRVESYAQADLLFEQKDEQISKLNMQLTDIKLKLHIKTTQLNTEIAKLKQKNNELQNEKNQLIISNQQLLNKNQLLTINKEQSETANKKVISNLKDKIKSLNDRITEQQKNMMDILIQKEEREKEYFELEKKVGQENVTKSKIMARYDEHKASARKSSKLVDQIGDITHLLDRTEDQLKYFQALFGQIEGRCTGQLCIALRSQYVKIFQQLLQTTKDLNCLSYITPKNRLECIYSQLQKLKQTQQQNIRLKQKIILLQSTQNNSNKNQLNKENIQQINKLKKKILILKRNLDQIDNKRKQQIDILISVMCQNNCNGRWEGKG